MKEFRQEGGVVKTEEEKREMAQKHRFKKNREFKERVDAQASNEEGDIRSFEFHSLKRNDPLYKRDNKGGRRKFKDDYDDHDNFRPRRRNDGFKSRGGKDFKGGDRRGGKKFDRNKSFDFDIDNED